MASQVSSCLDVQSVPESYIFPPETRPGKLTVPLCKTNPVIDLGKAVGQARTDIIQQISEACQRFGFFQVHNILFYSITSTCLINLFCSFENSLKELMVSCKDFCLHQTNSLEDHIVLWKQVINHGVPECLIIDTTKVFNDLFNLPAEDKVNVPEKNGWFYTDSMKFSSNGVHLWRENIKVPCQPLEEECVQLCPEKPNRYREIVVSYVKELRKLSLRILELICEGLGLEGGYFEESSEVQLLTANYYPPCPDPSTTLGLLRHCDPSLITILLEGDVSGLQVFKDGEWIGVKALSNAFVVIVGNQLEIISNQKLKSAEHRAVTNPSEARTSIATLINPSLDFVVEPAKLLVNDLNPPLYRPILYKEFVHSSRAFGPDTEAIKYRISSEL
ncbi:unnamed protein product [Ilex paraguariensis]|uniref:Fe2OG dioxygenase domain-containing protein n=1 Tax=Ilex paraguariensis TaxID=185542 RepID=A0ABC8R772_9AQUA